jgi:ubiquinone/menaquinone biosynthesis C-methylase UbiE
MTKQIDPEATKKRWYDHMQKSEAAWRKHDASFLGPTAPVTRRLLEMALVQKGQRVLDIATGTGEPAIPAAEAVGPEGFVLATDISDGMLAIAQEKAQARGFTNIEFQCDDVENISVEENSFDAILCRYGIMFMPDPERCLRNAAVGLKPGGRIALSVWGPLHLNPFWTLPQDVVRKYTEIPQPRAEVPGAFAFADPARLPAVLAQAGFREIETEEMELPICIFDSGYDYWTYFSDLALPVQEAFEKLPQDKQDLIAREVATVAGMGRPDNPVSLNGYTIFASARK